MTIAQMRIWLSEGERVRRNAFAQEARVLRMAFGADPDAFEEVINKLEN